MPLFEWVLIHLPAILVKRRGVFIHKRLSAAAIENLYSRGKVKVGTDRLDTPMAERGSSSRAI